MTPSEAKIISNEAAIALSKLLRSGSFKVVITNGCFDLLHVGHVQYLEDARKLGDHLIVGVNSDWAVKALKGAGRPINTTVDRMRVVAALQCVSYVVPVDALRVDQFIADMEAHTWVKGGDYTEESLDQAEVAAAQKAGTRIKILPVVPGISTTKLLEQGRRQEG